MTLFSKIKVCESGVGTSHKQTSYYRQMQTYFSILSGFLEEAADFVEAPELAFAPGVQDWIDFDFNILRSAEIGNEVAPWNYVPPLAPAPGTPRFDGVAFQCKLILDDGQR